jgi:prepilin-type N-terminal cleavage/methylation domain-containing protein
MRIKYQVEALGKSTRVSKTMPKKFLVKKNHAAGFTLIELLIAIGIIGIMAGMITYALLGATQDARTARTRGTIQKLNEVILQRWEEFRYRPVDYRSGSYRSATGITQQMIRPMPRTASHFITMIKRDTMRMEMPDRAGDLLFGPSLYVVPQNFPSAAANQNGSQLVQRAYSLQFRTMYRMLFQALQNSSNLSVITAMTDYPLTNPDNLPSVESNIGLGRPHCPVALDNNAMATWIEAWEGIIGSSEMLYLVVATANYGGSPALEMFRPSEIGDPDEDGLLEFIDAWGKPIQWIRWPAGFPSDLNRYGNTDALDSLRTDWRYTDSAYDETNRPQTIVPLIVSSGADELLGVKTGFAKPIVYARMTQGSGLNQSYVDPYFTWDFQNNVPNGSNSQPPYGELHTMGYRANQLGCVDVSLAPLAADDITNHDLILEP